MPDETLPPLPTSTSSKDKLTFKVPHILKSITLDENGFTHRDVREGRDVQLEYETVIEWSDTPIPDEETQNVFAIRATNQLNFAGAVINVLNDEIKLPEFQLVPTSPTASEYLALIGTRVCVSAKSRPDDQETLRQRGKRIYQNGRIFVTLP